MHILSVNVVHRFFFNNKFFPVENLNRFNDVKGSYNIKYLVDIINTIWASRPKIYKKIQRNDNKVFGRKCVQM